MCFLVGWHAHNGLEMPHRGLDAHNRESCDDFQQALVLEGIHNCLLLAEYADHIDWNVSLGGDISGHRCLDFGRKSERDKNDCSLFLKITNVDFNIVGENRNCKVFLTRQRVFGQLFFNVLEEYLTDLFAQILRDFSC